jgi:hypothetical protein
MIENAQTILSDEARPSHVYENFPLRLAIIDLQQTSDLWCEDVHETEHLVAGIKTTLLSAKFNKPGLETDSR